jgi:hypothetical protein
MFYIGIGLGHSVGLYVMYLYFICPGARSILSYICFETTRGIGVSDVQGNIHFHSTATPLQKILTTSGIRYRVSDIGYQVSGIRYQVGTGYRGTPGTWKLRPKVFMKNRLNV